MRMPRIALTALLALHSTITRADPLAVERGAVVIEQWCRLCHLRATDKPDPVMAPPYEEIVLREGRDRAYFERFLKEDHFPMTTFRLFDNEKADVVTYLMALQEAEQKKK